MGVSPYGLLRALTLGLGQGPLSPVWCALSLSFVPAILYAYVLFQERVTLSKYLSPAAVVFCGGRLPVIRLVHVPPTSPSREKLLGRHDPCSVARKEPNVRGAGSVNVPVAVWLLRT